MMKQIIEAVLPAATSVVQDVVANKLDPNRAESELVTRLLASSDTIQQAASENIRTEAASTHWLASNWRPITMMVFLFLIVCRWFGWTAVNLSEQEAIMLWQIVQLGLGGYVIGRSAEKILPGMIDALRK